MESKRKVIEKILNVCFDSDNKLIPLEKVIDNFETTEFIYLKDFYKTSSDEKIFKQSYNIVKESLSELELKLDRIEKELNLIEMSLYPTEDEEKRYIDLLNMQSKIERKIKHLS